MTADEFDIREWMRLYESLTRYPPILELEEYDMKKALKNALQILEFTKSKLAEMGFEAA